MKVSKGSYQARRIDSLQSGSTGSTQKATKNGCKCVEGESVLRGDTLLQLALASTLPTNHQIAVSCLHISKYFHCISSSSLMILPTDVLTSLPIRYMPPYQVAKRTFLLLPPAASLCKGSPNIQLSKSSMHQARLS